MRRFGRAPVQRSGAEHPAAVIYVERRLEIPVRLPEHDLPFPGDGVHVKHVPGHIALEKVKRLSVAQRIEDRPQLVRSADLPDADCRSGVSRLEKPWRGDLIEKRTNA